MEFGVVASIVLAAIAFFSTTLLFTLLRYSISTTNFLTLGKNLGLNFLKTVLGLKPLFLCKLFQQLPGFHLPPQEEHLHLPRQAFHPCRFNAGCHPGETLLNLMQERSSNSSFPPQSGSFCARLSYGPLPPFLSRIICMATAWLMAMIAGTIIFINGCRLFLVLYVSSPNITNYTCKSCNSENSKIQTKQIFE